MNRLWVKRLRSIGAVEDGDNPPAEILLYKTNPDKTGKIVDKSTDSAGNQGTIQMSDLDLSAVEETLRAEIEKTIAGFESRVAELEKAEPVDITKGMSDEVKAEFEKLEKQATDTAADLAKERDARLTVEWIGKARAYEKVLGDPEKAAPFLKGLDDETAEWLSEKLTKIEAVIAKSDLFKELGRGDVVPASEQIVALAIEKQKENTKLTTAQAKVLVRKENPGLRDSEREEGK